MARNALGLEFDSAAQLSKRPGSVWNCLWGNALKRSPGIIRKSRVSYPGPGFLSSAIWPSLPKKHYNGLNQTNKNYHAERYKGERNRLGKMFRVPGHQSCCPTTKSQKSKMHVTKRWMLLLIIINTMDIHERISEIDHIDHSSTSVSGNNYEVTHT